jgi:hypothetical protein
MQKKSKKWMLTVAWYRFGEADVRFTNILAAGDDPIEEFLRMREQYKAREWNVLINYFPLTDKQHASFYLGTQHSKKKKR